MSEPAAKPRSTGDYRDDYLDDMDRRMRETHDPQTPRDNDPLAELARLVGSGEADPFRRLFAQREPEPGSQPATIHHLRPYEAPRAPEGQHGYDAYAEPQAYAHPQDHADQQAWQAAQGYEQQGYEQQGHYDQQAHYDQNGHYAPPAHQAQSYAAYDQAYGDQHYAEAGQWDHADQSHYADYAEEAPRRSGRAKWLIAGALLVVAGGVGATFVMRSNGTMIGEPPTIMAASGPAKVQPVQPDQKAEQAISVLERGGSAPAETKTVQSGEQPIDLAQATKGQGASKPSRSADTGAPVTLAPPPPPPVANSLFAEPKRVKAVQVRPDGSIVEAAAPVRAAPAPAAPAARPNDIAALVAATTPASATPSAAKTPARLPDAKPAPTSATPAPAKPAAVAQTPVQVASATSGGGFAVQLAGTTSEEEAKDALSRLGRKFSSELGGLRPAIVKADIGSKTVYRVRVTNLSSDDANTLCAKLKASGGSCFVAKN